VTTGQSNSELCASLPRNFRGAHFADSSDDVGQCAHVWDARGRLRNMPALTLRAPIRGFGSSPLHLASTSPTGHTGAESSHHASQAEQLLTCSHEDVSRLNGILRSQQCTALMRGVDGAVLQFHTAEVPVQGGRNNIPAERQHSTSGATLLSTPIFDSNGRAHASLEITQADAAGSDSLEPLLLALAESAARAITERWFRLVHRRHSVVAAMQRNAPGTTLLFAIDRDQRIVGADRHARRLLEDKGQRMGGQFTVAAIFRSNPALLRRQGHGDVSTTLFASGDGEPWIALITPPDPGAMNSSRDARVLLHVRPRLDSLAHLSLLPSRGRVKRGLSQAALQRLEDYIAAHLDSDLAIDELAAIVRMSSSHFTRSFHKSAGVTPHRYVIQNRVMRARELLATTNLPLTEIALTTGFSDQSHFSRRFHEIVGIPPGAFRGNEGHFTP
jgi:AraC-like DNA-binding protein